MAMTASATRLNDAVYSTYTVGRSTCGFSVGHRIIGCSGFGVTNDNRSTPRGLLRQKISGETKRPSAMRSPRPYKTGASGPDRKSTRLNSSHSQISYAVFCLKKKKKE